jgi:hypothetical protein
MRPVTPFMMMPSRCCAMSVSPLLPTAAKSRQPAKAGIQCQNYHSMPNSR